MRYWFKSWVETLRIMIFDRALYRRLKFVSKTIDADMRAGKLHDFDDVMKD